MNREEHGRRTVGAFYLKNAVVRGFYILARRYGKAAYARLCFSVTEVHEYVLFAVNGKALGQIPFDVEMHLIARFYVVSDGYRAAEGAQRLY